MSEEVKEQPRLSLKQLDTRLKALQAEVDELNRYIIKSLSRQTQKRDERIAGLETGLSSVATSIGYIPLWEVLDNSV